MIFSVLEHNKGGSVCKVPVLLSSPGEILKLIKDEGFELTQLKELYLTPEQVERIYVQIVNKDFYKDVLQVLSE